jgi:hypothetical protein
VAGRRALGWLNREKVAPTWDGFDDPVSLVGQSMAHVSDALDQRIVGDKETGPDCPDEFFFTDHPAPIFDEVAQDVESFWSQFNLLLSPSQRASLQVQSVDVETYDAWGDSRHILNPAMASLFTQISANFQRAVVTGLRYPVNISRPQAMRHDADRLEDVHGNFDEA